MKITTKLASSSPVAVVIHKLFAVLFSLPSCCVPKRTHSETEISKYTTILSWVYYEPLERFSITFTSNGKHEFVPRDQVSSFNTCCLLFIISSPKLVVSSKFLSIRIVLSCFYLLIFYFEKFLTWIWCLLNSLMSLVVPFPGLGIDFRWGTYPWSTGTSNLVDVTTHFALLCQRLAIELCLENLWNLTNMASKAMKKKESKERVASAARTIPE